MARNTQRAGAAALFLSLGLCTLLTGCLGQSEWDDGDGGSTASPRLLSRDGYSDAGPRLSRLRRGRNGGYVDGDSGPTSDSAGAASRSTGSPSDDSKRARDSIGYVFHNFPKER